MKKAIFLITIFSTLLINAQSNNAYKSGEWLKFNISYSGLIKAGEATLKLKSNTESYNVKAVGKSTGALKWFFKVEDFYESYFSKETGLPRKFKRKINEGGYTKDLIIKFDQILKKAKVNNIKKNTIEEFKIKDSVQDMLSVFYHLRNNYNMFFDSENYEFKMKFLGIETINTKFGKIKCIKLRPFVQSGRVFKEKESLTLWISADKNKIPIKIKADLVVGSIVVNLDAFSGLNHPFEIKF